jgi:phosphohistidine phosphatase
MVGDCVESGNHQGPFIEAFLWPVICSGGIMHLYLVQHGRSKSGEVDTERHLTERGRADVEKVAALIKSFKLHIDSIWHSGKARAAETADILTAAVGSPVILQRPGLAPNDPVDPVRKELIKISGELLIVGHMPFLGKLASALVAGEESKEIMAFQQGGIVCLGCGTEDRDQWRVEWMIVPDLLP